ncbi:hypothetical protein KHA93_08600 [Bacillus sp. FJAT-49732]|uniref:Uncharacterized protein n=1 Tax=Lederbergia citrisecunda TaxID=2833583 RepID=A0A942YKW1_9BACI|nr:hypothetical protein [Lederbergia citrisecunda]MBS4199714.1 hypothetical protein [Lederbergia citrisecunda]
METFLLFILVAAISFIFKRKSGTNQQEEREHRMPPPVARPIQTYFEQEEEPVKPMQQVFPELTKARNLKEVADILITKTQPTVNDKQEELKKKLEELKVEEEKHRMRAKTIKQVDQHNKHEQVPEFQFQANDILKGIVMSEVLGPPRSLKPYEKIKRL